MPDKLIYEKEASEFTPIPDNFDFDRFSKKVYAIRNKDFQKVDGLNRYYGKALTLLS